MVGLGKNTCQKTQIIEKVDIFDIFDEDGEGILVGEEEKYMDGLRTQREKDTWMNR